MKNKPLITLAVLAAAGAASAQSSVTLFGVVDTSISRYTTESTFYSSTLFAVPPLGAPASVKRSQTALSRNGYNSNRLGFRGTEDLGGGLAASFWLETSINPDDGSKGINNFDRRSTVSLSGGFGEIRLGRDYVSTFWNDTVFDPFGTTGVGANLIYNVNINLHVARGPGSLLADNYVRTSNSIGYVLPPNLGGFYGQLQYALHENVKSSDAFDSPSTKGRYVGGRFGYANGPLDVAASYAQSTAADAVVAGLASENKLNTFNFGASYDFGPLKLFGEYSRVEDKLKSAVAVPGFGALATTDRDKYTGGLVGMTVPVGPGLIRASYSRVKYKNDLPYNAPMLFGLNNFDASANKIAIGYVHNLSKRTVLYATVARIRIKDGQNNPAIMGATTGGSPTFASTGGGTTGLAPYTATGYDFGIRHAF